MQAQNRRGAVIVLVAFLLMVICIFGAMAINIAYIDLCQAELQTATDAATRAAARTLQQTGKMDEATKQAKALASANIVAGEPLVLKTEDVEFGIGSRTNSVSRYSFVAGGTKNNAVSVRGRRDDGSASGRVQLFFGNFLGVQTIEKSANSIATLSELDVVIVLDKSGSMAYEADETIDGVPDKADNNDNGVLDDDEWYFGDPPPIPGSSRWESVLNETSEFLNKFNSTAGTERVSVVTFSSSAATLADFTSSYTGLMNVLATESPNGMTAIGDGISQGTSQFLTSPNHRGWASRVMIVLTDGQNNTGIDPLVAAQNARNQGIVLHTISFTSNGSMQTMQDIASIGGGTFSSALNQSQLDAAFEKIFDSLPVLLIK
ncbi:MAG: vWA domain-containing protein [Pirellulaceae bacterium]